MNRIADSLYCLWYSVYVPLCGNGISIYKGEPSYRNKPIEVESLVMFVLMSKVIFKLSKLTNAVSVSVLTVTPALDERIEKLSKLNRRLSPLTDGGFPPVGISLSPQAIKPTAANIASITAIIITNLFRKVNGFKIGLFIKSMFCFHKNSNFTTLFKMHKYGNNNNFVTALFNYSYGSH